MGSSRREFLAAGAGAVLAAGAIVPRADADWQASGRYPDPAIKIVDPSFLKYRVNSAKVERLGTGYRWSEGPVWFGDGRYLLWSDIPNNRILKWEEETGAISVFRKPSNNANGIRAIARGASSPASTTRGASRAPNTTARSPWSRIASRARR